MKLKLSALTAAFYTVGISGKARNTEEMKRKMNDSATITLLGLDIGTSSCKAALFDLDGNLLASQSAGYSSRYPREGWDEQDPQEWWEGVCQVCRNISAYAEQNSCQIAAIGLSGQSWSCIAIDKDGNVLCPDPIWRDVRSDDICRRLNQKIGPDKILTLAGNPLQPAYTTGKIIWIKENRPDIYNQTWKFLQSNSYIAYKLTGVVSQDYSQGYGLHCFDIDHLCWDKVMAFQLGIDLDKLPDLYPSDAMIGKVTSEASALTGLEAGIPVAAGGLDSACGALGAGVYRPGDTQEQGGQSEGMSICMEKPLRDPNLILSVHVIPGLWLLQGGTSGGSGVMRWLEQELADYERHIADEKHASSLDQFNESAAKIPPGSDGLIFLPYMNGERSPIWNPHAKGVWYGLDFSKTKGHLILSAMEGVAFSLKHNLDIAKAAGAEVSSLKATGGSSNSLLWTQIKSDISNLPIEVPLADASCALGAAILAGVGCGIYEDYPEAIQRTIRFTRHHEPDPDTVPVYSRNYKKYLEIYQHLEPMMQPEKPE